MWISKGISSEFRMNYFCVFLTIFTAKKTPKLFTRNSLEIHFEIHMEIHVSFLDIHMGIHM